jgi:hypothetical protein
LRKGGQKMKFELQAADEHSLNDLPKEIEIESLSELKELSKKYDETPLVIAFDDEYGNKITIYNGYLE